jgi:hypothetical protein
VAVSGGIVEHFGPVDAETWTTSAAVIAGRLVEATGNRRCGPAGVGSLVVVGVAMQDASAAEDKVAVATDGVVPCRASGAIAAGQRVIAAAAGDVAAAGATPDARTVVGIAVEAISGGATGPVRLML